MVERNLRWPLWYRVGEILPIVSEELSFLWKQKKQNPLQWHNKKYTPIHFTGQIIELYQVLTMNTEKDHHWVYEFPKEIYFLALNLVISRLIAKNIFYLKLENPSC